MDGSACIRYCRDTLDENSHKHAFAVSGDLKYALRESIEFIGNEAVCYLREVRKEKICGKQLAEQLTPECLRYMYRLLFLRCIEARPFALHPRKNLRQAGSMSYVNLDF